MNNTLEKNLRCPLCLSELKKTSNALICSKNKHRFEIRQGIPILLDYPNLPVHSQKQQSHFENVHKPTFDSLTHTKRWKVRYIERFVKNFKAIKNKCVLEIGTGGGYMAIGLAKLGAKVIACDITIKNLIVLKEFAKTLGIQNNLLLVCCSADQLPFKNNICDYFVMNSVLEHIPAEEKAISEIKRMLKIGGGLMITAPVKYKYIFPLFIPINYLHDKRIGHLRRYDDVSLRSKFPGFFLKRVYFTGHPLKVIKFMINSIVKIFDDQVIENEDEKMDSIKKWSSNLIAFLHKQ